jgi:hypothetical protein
MPAYSRWGRDQASRSRPRWPTIGLLLLTCCGCQVDPPNWPAPRSPREIPDADTGFTLVKTGQAEQATGQPMRVVHDLGILHMLVPQDQARAMEKAWNFLREDALDAETRLRLQRNGLRVGVGHAQWWEPIRAAIEAIEGHQVMFTAPVRLPVGFPLSLELDSEPRDQTLFYIAADGILSGNTWPDSRNVLRVTYLPDPHDADSVVLFAVPEVHQRQDGWEWIRTEAGITQIPRHAMQRFDAAGFVIRLRPGEFALVAPHPNSDVYGLLGGAFLTQELQGRQYDSYVFLRPEAKHVGQQD